jgi:hypothetical protein
VLGTDYTGGRGDRVICDCRCKGQTTGDRGVRPLLGTYFTEGWGVGVTLGGGPGVWDRLYWEPGR